MPESPDSNKDTFVMGYKYMSIYDFINSLTALGCIVSFVPPTLEGISLSIQVRYPLLPPYQRHVLMWSKQLDKLEEINLRMGINILNSFFEEITQDIERENKKTEEPK